MAQDYKYNIRAGKPSDVHEIAEVFSDSVRNLCKNDYDHNIIDQWITSISPESRLRFINSNVLWVAEVDKKIAGYLISIPGEIIALFVGSAYPGLGVGSALAKLGIEVAKNDQTDEVKIQSTLTAVPFYRKLGFREVGKGFYTYSETELELPIVNMVLSPSPSTH